MATITFVKKTTKTTSSSSTSTTVTGVGSGNGRLLVAALILVNGSSSGAPISSISDSAGNTWTRPSSYSDQTPPAAYVGGLAVAVCYAQNADAVSSITFHYPSCDKFIAVVLEASGAATTGVLTDSWGGIASSTNSVTMPASGWAVAVACTSNATSISSGWREQFNSSGNLAADDWPGSSPASTSMSWSPSQNAAAAIVAFKPQADTNGTATLTESESLSAKATIAPIASLVETEALSATAGTVAQAEFSCLAQDQSDENGIAGKKGLTSYHWATTLDANYDRYASLQEGQLVAGGTGAPDLNLYRNSSTEWKTDDSLIVDGNLTVNGMAETAFTPTWSASTTNPSLGNGTVDAAYLRFGPLVFVRIYYVFGTTTAFGSGAYGFTLPIAPKDGQTLSVVCSDSSASNRLPGAAWLTSSSGIFRVTIPAGSFGVSSTSPFTWGSGDGLLISGVYYAQ